MLLMKQSGHYTAAGGARGGRARAGRAGAGDKGLRGRAGRDSLARKESLPGAAGLGSLNGPRLYGQIAVCRRGRATKNQFV